MDRDHVRSAMAGNDQILYSVDETPPWYLCILLGLQVRYKVTITVYIPKCKVNSY